MHIKALGRTIITAQQALQKILRSYIRWTLPLLLGWFVWVNNSFAVGLGELKHSSFLGEPLQAHIELINISTRLDLNQLRARQIQGEEAQSLGVDLVSGWMPVRVILEQRNNGYQISLSTRQPVKEPLVNVLIELTWPNGTIFREYNVMLNPQSYKKGGKRAANLRVETLKPDTNPTPKAAVNKPNYTPGSSKYTVTSGDTLMGIAQQIVTVAGDAQAAGVQAISDWLLTTNPDAFIDGDMHRLIAGATLILPADIDQLDPAVKKKQSEPTTSDEKYGRLRLENIQRGSSRADNTLESRLAANEDLMQVLIKENNDLRQRLDKIENSGYLGVLKSLVDEQRLEISKLHQQLRDAIAGTPTSRTTSAAGGRDTPAKPVLEVSQASTKGFNFMPVIPQLNSPLLLWLALGVGALSILLAAIAGAAYFRSRTRAAAPPAEATVDPDSERYEFSALWQTEHVSNSTTQKYYEVSEEFPEVDTTTNNNHDEAQPDTDTTPTVADQVSHRPDNDSAKTAQKDTLPKKPTQEKSPSEKNAAAPLDEKRAPASNDTRVDEIEIDEDLENYLKL
ncbi:MAG: hypothetical protein KTR17_11235 [Cellvibrionaceae bacterium]|nr:hypothetical protein [Cellvibrionaceae bacterium]